MIKMGFIFIDEREHNRRENEISMSAWEVRELLEYSDIIIKWLKKNINRIQTKLALCELQGRENEAYISIDTIKNLIKSLEETEKTYQDFLNRVTTDGKNK